MGLDKLRLLYQTEVLDYDNNPRNKFAMINPTAFEVVHNPSCGDTVTVFVKLVGNKIEDVSFTGTGCTISQASASMMTVAVKGKTKDEALKMAKIFSDMAMGKKHLDKELTLLGDAAILTQVMQFPTRIKCATISWWALSQALLKKGKVND